ncbi:MAG: hypothetical protein ACRD6W_11655, partial [Nitrososphaerales archaeon]
MVDTPPTVEGDVATAGEVVARGGGVGWAYAVLERLATRHRLSDAWLVLGPRATRAAAGAGNSQDTDPYPLPQLFGLGGRPILPDRARTLLQQAAGVYGEPQDLDSSTNAALGAMCGAAFRAAAAASGAAVDPLSGLWSRAVIDAAVARAAASSARYGWSSTLVLLTTDGDVPPEDRWLALGAAVRKALRTGDEVGVTVPGVALAVLGNAGPDAVRPFVARVRAALSAGGSRDVDLHAAASRTPEETVDPAELKRLAATRLREAGVGVPALPNAAPTLELELRLLPEVVCVSMATPIVVVSRSSRGSLHDEVVHAVGRHLPEATVRLVFLDDAPPVAGRPAADSGVPPVSMPAVNGNGSASTRGSARREEDAPPRAISATAPGEPGRATSQGGGSRVSLLAAAFDPKSGTSEVSLALGAARGIGHAPSGPLAGGAQATLNALGALGFEVPFFLVSAERAHGVPGDPIVVVLAPKRTGAEGADGDAERLGV